MIEPIMNSSTSPLMGAKEIQKLLGISKGKAYQIIKQLNNELKADGFITIQGKVSTKYFNERVAI